MASPDAAYDGKPDLGLEAKASAAEFANSKTDALNVERQAEHDLTIKQVLTRHPALVWWSFYWAMAAVGWGFDAQINGAMISVSAFRRDFGYVQDGESILPADWQTAFNVISSVGQFFGGFLCSWVCDYVGRKSSLAIGLLFATGGIFGEVFSHTNVTFLISKLILGFGLGFFLTLAPLATSEIAPVVFRGISTAGVNLGVAVGQLLSNAVIKGLGSRSDNWAYRGPFATQLFFVLFLGLGLPFVPETPWYLARKGKFEAAKQSLRKLYGSGVDVDAKLAGIQATIAEEESTRVEEASWAQCFKGTDRVRTMISMGVFVCQHLVGIVFVLGYSTYFFQLAGLAESRSFDLGVGVTACGVAGNICSWFVINSFGRRKIFLGGMLTVAGLLFLMGIMDVVPTDAAKWVQAACSVIYAFVYFATVGAMAFAVLGECCSLALKAKTMALATATQAVMGLAMNFAIPYMVNPDEANLKGKVGFVFGGLALIGFVWSWAFVPELKGRRYDEIDRLFELRVPPRKMAHLSSGRVLINFVALSYVWGDLDDAVPPYAPGQTVSATKNLHAILEGLTSSDFDQLLWIDALCINQHDLGERAAQVALMGEIYSRAEYVLAFLSSLSDPFDIGLAFLEQAADNPDLHYEPSLSPRNTVKGLDAGSETLRDSLIACFAAPYIYRYMVDSSVDDSKVVLAAFTHLAYHERRCCWAARRAADGNARGFLDLASQANGGLTLYTATLRINNLMSALGTERSGDYDLLGLISLFRTRRCSDPRDRVFGMSGLHIRDPEKLSKLPTDYTLSTALLYWNLARGPSFHQRMAGLPSWVPDWDAIMDDDYHLIYQERVVDLLSFSRASAETKPAWALDDAGSVATRGLQIGRVAATAPGYPRTGSTARGKSLLEEWRVLAGLPSAARVALGDETDES
ncbi:hypothetical protein FZEAL_3386 [Fusarium zealandicum]|uniref:Major facilitator superfamily (MFS) profile domain-containing protein n=1 Tax=Fusarium zealandicum TaxID=1053134 RepID=A0A8H4UNR5_9HYPO|nr:hypothetical protein FZEAL_3386 [Fusarium zealandicum]